MNPSAASNRLLGILNGLKSFNLEITVIILGGYFSNIEFKRYQTNGSVDGISYTYLNKLKNISLFQRRISEYIVYPILGYILFHKIKKLLSNLNEEYFIWLEYDMLSFQIAHLLPANNNLKFFIELNEFPDIHKYNQSTKYFWQRASANKTFNFFFKKIIPRLHGMALMTETLLRYYQPKVNPKTKLLHLPMTVDLKRFDLAKTYEPIEGLNCSYIAFVGSMNDAKDGVNLLIEAFGLISNDYPEYKLALFGFWAYDTSKHLYRIQELGIQDKVIYSKPIDSEKVLNLIMNSDILVLPRPDSYQAKGGFPTKLGEYLASSKPVIVTKVGEIPNYLIDQKSAFFAEPGSVESLANALKFVLFDLDKSESVGLEGRKVAEMEFSSIIQSKKLESFLKEI
ncbi:MAG: glycosyltransferase [Bacteroidia bacterium]|nr:glycosyltransferase [Bacteroidia bacterium]MCF8445920.1 glycosyltransferase [Bacteroidia bacterium]